MVRVEEAPQEGHGQRLDAGLDQPVDLAGDLILVEGDDDLQSKPCSGCLRRSALTTACCRSAWAARSPRKRRTVLGQVGP